MVQAKLDLGEDLVWRTMNPVGEPTNDPSADIRRTSPTAALRMTSEKVFAKDALKGYTRYTGIVVSKALERQYPRHSDKQALLKEYVRAKASTSDKVQKEKRFYYKVYIPELEPRPAPKSRCDSVLATYPDVAIMDGVPALYSGQIVTVVFEDKENLKGPIIIERQKGTIDWGGGVKGETKISSGGLRAATSVGDESGASRRRGKGKGKPAPKVPWDDIKRKKKRGVSYDMTLSNDAWKTWVILRAVGYTEETCAGMLGTFAAESGLNPSVINKRSSAYGLAQWLDVRDEHRLTDQSGFARSAGSATLQGYAQSLPAEDLLNIFGPRPNAAAAPSPYATWEDFFVTAANPLWDNDWNLAAARARWASGSASDLAEINLLYWDDTTKHYNAYYFVPKFEDIEWKTNAEKYPYQSGLHPAGSTSSLPINVETQVEFFLKELTTTEPTAASYFSFETPTDLDGELSWDEDEEGSSQSTRKTPMYLAEMEPAESDADFDTTEAFDRPEDADLKSACLGMAYFERFNGWRTAEEGAVAVKREWGDRVGYAKDFYHEWAGKITPLGANIQLWEPIDDYQALLDQWASDLSSYDTELGPIPGNVTGASTTVLLGDADRIGGPGRLFNLRDALVGARR